MTKRIYRSDYLYVCHDCGVTRTTLSGPDVVCIKCGAVIHWRDQAPVKPEEAPMAKPPMNTYIEWDGSETPPVPVPAGTDVTLWEDGAAERGIVSSVEDWRDVTAYLVHAYPPEDEVEEYMLEKMNGRIIALGPNCAPHSRSEWNGILRFTNGVAEIVSHEKA